MAMSLHRPEEEEDDTMVAGSLKSVHTQEEFDLFLPATDAYQRVFGRAPEVEERRLPGGSPALLFGGWLLLYPTGRGDYWGVRTVETEVRFRKLPCLRRGSDVERPNLESALIHMLQMEAHRYYHEAA